MFPTKKRYEFSLIPLFFILSKLWFDRLVVMGVGAGGTTPQHLAFCNLADKHHVAAQIQFFQYLAAEHGVGVLRHIHQTVVASFRGGKAGKFIHIPSGLHAEMTNGLKGNILCQHADVKYPRLFDHLLGQIPFLAGNRHPGGIFGDLNSCIGDAAIILVRFPGA